MVSLKETLWSIFNGKPKATPQGQLSEPCAAHEDLQNEIGLMREIIGAQEEQLRRLRESPTTKSFWAADYNMSTNRWSDNKLEAMAMGPNRLALIRRDIIKYANGDKGVRYSYEENLSDKEGA